MWRSAIAICRSLQRPLMVLGLSSLGRLESRVLPTLAAVKAALAALAGLTPEKGPSSESFFAGERQLAERTHELLGGFGIVSPIALLVTCPTEAADEPSFMVALAQRGVEAVRINCAHDDADHWQRMIDHVRAAEKATGRRLKILMDLAGPKIRTGKVRLPEGRERIGKAALLAIVPPGGLDGVASTSQHFAVECTLSEALGAAKVGDRLFVDDGKLGAEVEGVEEWGVARPRYVGRRQGHSPQTRKGLKLPRHRIEDCGAHRQGSGRSRLRRCPCRRHRVLVRPVRRRRKDAPGCARRTASERLEAMSLILKIETAQAVHNLPDLVVQAAGQQPTGIMIARGDLAVEIGFGRMAEMQEEILWIGEAAHVPVIWATQVLEHLIKKGTPSRGEMTDAAMAARAECVMLNKGPYLFEAINELDTLLARMDTDQHKKTPQLRQLLSW